MNGHAPVGSGRRHLRPAADREALHEGDRGLAAADERLLAGLLVVPFAFGLGSAAQADDGGPGQADFSFRDPAVVESSGLVAQDGLVYTSNDSGDSGRIFAVDPGSGETVGVTRWSDEPTDVEALAPEQVPRPLDRLLVHVLA